MGGDERLARHHAKGKAGRPRPHRPSARPGTFQEFGTLVGGEIAADGIVTGAGRIDGTPVMVGAEDFTTLAGSIGPGGNAKRFRLAELALRQKIPLIMLLEGAGFRPRGEHYGRSPTDLIAQAQCSGKVPTISAVLGPSAGHGALVAPVCDFTIMSAQGAIFTAGPRWSKSPPERRSRRRISVDPMSHCAAVIHNFAETDGRRSTRSGATCPTSPPAHGLYPPTRLHDASGELRPTRNCSTSSPGRTGGSMTCAVLDVVFDDADWMEVQPRFGPAIICALAHLGGYPVAVVANQPTKLAGSIDADAADKAAHFIMVADSFHLPIVFLADNPGMLPGGRPNAVAYCAVAQDVRRPDRGHHAEAPPDPAQGVRVRVDGDVAAGIRQPGGDVRLSGATMGAMSAAALSRPPTPTRTSPSY